MAALSSSSDSPLLRCLAQLNDDVWTQTLLPKLLADGSAPSAALACSRLRQLCQRSRQQLKLTSLSSADTATVRGWTEQLPQRFPACSSVTMGLCEQSCPTAPVIVEVLSRMPVLSSLTLEVTLGRQPLGLAVVISNIGSRLPSLRELHPTCADSWEQGAQQVWEQLGSLTQVTCLEVTFDTAGADREDTAKGCLLHHLAPLRNLAGLQQLCIGACKRQQQQQPGQGQGEHGSGFQFLEALTALTHLDISVASTLGLSSISSCTALQALRLRPVRTPSAAGRLTAADWEAVGQLAQLTKLHVNPYHQPQHDEQLAQEPFFAALSKLAGLQFVGYCIWTAAALPVLAGLPRLRCVSGVWLMRVGDAAGAKCEQVTRIEHTAHVGGMVDLGPFPNLEVYCPIAGSIDAEAWQGMTSLCRKLRDIRLQVDATNGLLDVFTGRTYGTFDSGVTVEARLSALRSLSQLTALTQLSFKSSHRLEVAALADAVPCVRELHIVALTGVDCMCLMPLAKLAEQSLTRLFLYFEVCPARVHDVQVLLSAMSRVPKVVVAGLRGTTELVVNAVQGARGLGLLLPADLRVASLHSG